MIAPRRRDCEAAQRAQVEGIAMVGATRRVAPTGFCRVAALKAGA